MNPVMNPPVGDADVVLKLCQSAQILSDVGLRNEALQVAILAVDISKEINSAYFGITTRDVIRLACTEPVDLQGIKDAVFRIGRSVSEEVILAFLKGPDFQYNEDTNQYSYRKTWRR